MHNVECLDVRSQGSTTKEVLSNPPLPNNFQMYIITGIAEAIEHGAAVRKVQLQDQLV